MCNRHVPHLIAEYEASRQERNEETEDEEDHTSTDRASGERDGLLATFASRFAR